MTLGYDPALRLYQIVSGATTTRFLYDGADAIAEYNGSNALQRRFVFDPTTGQPVVWYEGTGTLATIRRYLSQDERKSVISIDDYTGAPLRINTYDEYGKPGVNNLGRYQYTGQKWIGEANVYDYKARDYVQHVGIFAQTDPIGYWSGPNLYAYVHDDPVNFVDPSGMVDWVAVARSAYAGAWGGAAGGLVVGAYSGGVAGSVVGGVGAVPGALAGAAEGAFIGGIGGAITGAVKSIAEQSTSDDDKTKENKE